MSVKAELEAFGKYVVQQSKSNLTKKGKKDTSTLYDGMTFKVTETKRNTTLVFSFGAADDYWEFVDKGVKGMSSSKKAPNSPFKFGKSYGSGDGSLTKAINGWVGRNRIQFKDRQSGKFLSYKSTSFLIARSIYQKGLATTNFFTKPFEQAFKRLPDAVYEAYALEVENQLKIRLE